MNWLTILLIRFYQLTLSRVLKRKGVRCRHYPSCSQYGILAFKKYNFLKACDCTWKRFQDCHPFSGRPYIDFP
jgi:putative membrane protein insertion efficiency factor